MLPDFLVPLSLARTLTVQCRDIPAWLYLYQMPDLLPGAECFTRTATEHQRRVVAEWEHWANQVLTRVVVAPRLTLELVARLGDDRDHLLVTYQRAIGWLPADPDSVDLEEAPSRAGRIAAPLAARVWVPGPNIQSIITVLATKTRVDAWTLQCRSISEWIWLYRVHAQDALQRKQARVSEDIERIGTTA